MIKTLKDLVLFLDSDFRQNDVLSFEEGGAAGLRLTASPSNINVVIAGLTRNPFTVH